jgi:DNA-binding transcriptional ArsR family regulator
VLSNPARLRLLDRLFARAPLTVTAVATAFDLDLAVASRHLRALQARGLLSVERSSRYALYRAEADPLVPQSHILLAMFREAKREGVSVKVRVHALTAFTHPRRISIVQALSREAMSAEELRAACHISSPAVYRHMDKLIRRGLVAVSDQGVFRLIPPRKGFAGALLRLALNA